VSSITPVPAFYQSKFASLWYARARAAKTSLGAPDDSVGPLKTRGKSACAPQPADHIMLACGRLIMLAMREITRTRRAGFARDFGE
jgi:hypothetical protein